MPHMGEPRRFRRPANSRSPRLLLNAAALCLLTFLPAATSSAQDKDDEIVATLAGGRVIVHGTREDLTFAVINEPVENGDVPPRIVSLDSHHVGVLLGSSEWRIPAEPNPIRLDKGLAHIAAQDPNYRGSYNGDAEPDLETMGVAFLEKLTPLAARLHHKIEFPTDQPLFEMVVIGFGPADYGSEVWTIEYRISQSNISSRGDFWQTRVLRPRFEQIYPPEKKAPRKLVETCYPGACKGPSLQQLLEGNEPSMANLSGSDPKFTKAVDFISKGQAQKAQTKDFAAFLRAAIPVLYPGHQFVMGTFEEQHGFEWLVPPDEPVERAQKEKDNKDRPPEAPTLRRRVDPPR
jgi:hypothetical protein